MSSYNPPPAPNNLEAPLELPAVPGKPLTTQGGSTLDDGSGNAVIAQKLSLASISGGDSQLVADGPGLVLSTGSSSSVGRFTAASGIGYFEFTTSTASFTANEGTALGSLTINSTTFNASGHINANPTTPALPTNPPVSGTVYQNTTGGPIIITVPITATAVGGSGQWALGSTNAPGNWGGAEQIGVSGEVHNMTLYVPNNWYWSLTVTNATIGTASVLGQ